MPGKNSFENTAAFRRALRVFAPFIISIVYTGLVLLVANQLTNAIGLPAGRYSYLHAPFRVALACIVAATACHMMLAVVGETPRWAHAIVVAVLAAPLLATLEVSRGLISITNLQNDFWEGLSQLLKHCFQFGNAVSQFDVASPSLILVLALFVGMFPLVTALFRFNPLRSNAYRTPLPWIALCLQVAHLLALVTVANHPAIATRDSFGYEFTTSAAAHGPDWLAMVAIPALAIWASFFVTRVSAGHSKMAGWKECAIFVGAALMAAIGIEVAIFFAFIGWAIFHMGAHAG